MSGAAVEKEAVKMHLASLSPLKSAIVREWLSTQSSFGDELELVAFEPEPTNCPQPLGLESARACIDKRLFNAPEPSHFSCVLAIENYIESVTEEPKGERRFYDRVLVVVRFVDCDGDWFEKWAVSPHSIHVPDFLVPLGGTPDIADPPGFSCTVGSLAHAADSCVPSDDWFRSCDGTNPSRREQILAALHLLMEPNDKSDCGTRECTAPAFQAALDRRERQSLYEQLS